jgi:hypothetical protein
MWMIRPDDEEDKAHAFGLKVAKIIGDRDTSFVSGRGAERSSRDF